MCYRLELLQFTITIGVGKVWHSVFIMTRSRNNKLLAGRIAPDNFCPCSSRPGKAGGHT